MTAAVGFISAATSASDGRFTSTSNSDFLILERMAEHHGPHSVITDLISVVSGIAQHAAMRSRRARNPDRRANLDLQAELYFQAVDALVRAEHSAKCAASVTIEAPVE